MATCKEVLTYLFFKRNVLTLWLTPLLQSPLLIIYFDSQAARCGYVMLILLVYWIVQPIPLQATGLIGLFMYPMLGILTIDETCEFFMIDFIVLFVSLMFIASAVERYGLHRRIALRALLIAGSDPKWLLLALMLVNGFLSLWILNLSLVSMMLPIVEALVDLLSTSFDESPSDNKQFDRDDSDSVKKTRLEDGISLELADVADEMKRDNSDMATGTNKSTEILSLESEELKDKNSEKAEYDIRACFNIGLVYSATIGGAASSVGSVIQIIMNANLQVFYGPEAKVNFGNWFLFSAPTVVVSLPLAWMWLAFYYLDLGFWCCLRNRRSSPGCCCRGNEDEKKDRVALALRKQYDELGSMSWAEVTTLLVFLFLIVVWVFEEPQFVPGWNEWFKPGYVTSASATCFVAFMCFLLPGERPSFNLEDRNTKYVGLLERKYCQQIVPWGLVMYAGTLMASVQATRVSGLGGVLGEMFSFVSDLEYWEILVAVTLIAIILTEITSGAVILAVTLPILARASLELSVHPYYFVLSLTLANNLAFCLPSGTVVNALIISLEATTTYQMLKTGIVMNIICIIVLNVFANTYGWWLLKLDEIPVWAIPTNATSAG
ncbi:Na(+)/citrate cotransporter-like isoform X2 [Ptychodera flava]|uniref:Na(+)/citrate cotransporter-like isoform X2 n=1 Tax=Ptychodera flava TaxID=63121 RepID=UPI00396A7CB3